MTSTGSVGQQYKQNPRSRPAAGLPSSKLDKALSGARFVLTLVIADGIRTRPVDRSFEKQKKGVDATRPAFPPYLAGVSDRARQRCAQSEGFNGRPGSLRLAKADKSKS